MPAKPTVEQVAQIGVENVAGTPVPATFRLDNLDLTMQPMDETDEVRPSGSYFVTTVYQTFTASEGSGDGVPCYNNAKRIFDLVFGTATTTGTPGATAGTTVAPYTHDYTFKTTRPTWTVEQGDAGHAARASHVYATSLALEWGKNSRTATLELGLAGGLYEDGVTLTAASSVTGFPVSPATALQADLFLDPTAAGYGTTKVTNALNVRFVLDGLATGTSYLDSAKPSISDTVNQAPDASVELVVDADTAGRAWRQLLRDNAVRYMRIAVTAPNGDYIRLDMPVRVKETGARDDEDAQYVARYTLRITREGADQLKAALRNGIAS